MFGTFLKAQETAATITLAHAKVSDAGALEIAQFLVCNKHLTRLDLTGNEITSTGVLHIAKALKQNDRLESLVLRHNRLVEGGDDGIAALCRALAGESVTPLRHLDLRHNALGSAAVTCIGEMLQGNKRLTHLELSWNPLNVAAGQVLFGYLRRNTWLLDCQLTGCGLAEEQLLEIAQLLHRNRIARGSDMQPGPFEVATETRGLGGSVQRALDLEAALADGGQLIDPQAPAAVPLGLDAANGSSTAAVGPPSAERTNDLMVKLLAWRDAPGGVSPTDAARAEELFRYLDRLQKGALEDRGAVGRLRERVDLMQRGFQDRELRYRADIAVARDRLLAFGNEYLDLQAVRERFADHLRVTKESGEIAQHDFEAAKRHAEDEEALLVSQLALVRSDTKRVQARLEELSECASRVEAEHLALRARTAQIREGVVTHAPPSGPRSLVLPPLVAGS